MSSNRAYSRLGFGNNHSNGFSNGHNNSCPLNGRRTPAGQTDSPSDYSFTETDSGSKSRPRSRLTINCKQSLL